MIARVWRGATRAEDAEEYAAYVEESGLKAARALDGSRGTLVLRRVDGDTVRSFAGDDIERAVFFPEDDRFLVERDLHVAHHEVDARVPG